MFTEPVASARTPTFRAPAGNTRRTTRTEGGAARGSNPRNLWRPREHAPVCGRPLSDDDARRARIHGAQRTFKMLPGVVRLLSQCVKRSGNGSQSTARAVGG